MKQMFKMLFVVLVVALVSISSVQAYDVNKDLKNLGPDAYDIAVILNGTETVTEHYDGYPLGYEKVGWFNQFSHGPENGNTKLHWQSFNDGTDNVINTDQVIHVGWSTNDHSSSVKDMYWTDKEGHRIAGSIVFNITSGWAYEQNRVYIHWEHIYEAPTVIEIRNVRFAILASPVPLANLNTENTQLNSQLVPLGGSSQIMVGPGQTVTRVLPIAVAPTSVVVLRYEVLGAGSDAESLDYIQFPLM